MIQRRKFGLAAGDVAALVAFGLIGLASHEDGLTPLTFARAVLPFVAAWLVVGLFAGVWTGGGSWRRLFAAWLVAGVIALAARALIFDRQLFNAFFVIALVGNGLFLAAWRAIYGIAKDHIGAGPAGRGTKQAVQIAVSEGEGT
jgi:hypothetical protein